jgi:Arc/MetJ-type ribon-helix-helix transcriptional regulator
MKGCFMSEDHNDPNQPNDDGGQLTSQTRHQGASSRAGETIDEITSTLRDLFSRVPDTFSKAVERAINVRDTTVLLRLSDESSDKVDTLVSAGVFRSRAEAAAFLIEEGIKAQSALFQRIQDKLTEIEKLRSDLRNSISPEMPK